MQLEIVVTDRYGHITDHRIITSDLLLRNYLGELKKTLWANALQVADNIRDVNNNVYTGGAGSITPNGMLGSGATPATSADYKIQTPLYVVPDSVSVGFATLGVGNQVTLALVHAHTFAAATTVTEAGLVQCHGSSVTYLTNNNIQISHDVFTGIPIPIGGTFTGTYTKTEN